MAGSIVRSSRSGPWALAERQHGVVARTQLLELGLSSRAIEHRISRGRLHPVWRGVYAIGRPRLTVHGRWMAAVLSCGPDAALSHESAAALWDIRPRTGQKIHVSVPAGVARRRPRIVVHRRTELGTGDVKRRHAIPVTAPIYTLIDIATRVDRDQLEAAINEADKRDLTDPEQLRASLDGQSPRPGIRALRETLDRRTFALTDSELERRFLPLARRAGLPLPQTGRHLNGFKVDFHWPKLGLVVETDGLRYHRTPAQQTRDRVRDHAHAAAGLTPLRFTRAQVVFEPDHVRSTLAAVARRLEPSRGPLG
jgi:very-short-patch-repair endonuclease